ncbi:hypothetical protein OS189_17085 [Sulfitobacter sp. F26169L]|uniref:hypothetical protein n=1 Tax=Sulfitobacter sp. F26169L TaxID=2996015 RepID=UPI002260B1C0|nr:hypothetical protein [Sulfitobacter sp. F26169L]MCX7568059.1 hypothetical protein [Sulfitobacter sp. F26169L]
MTDSIDTDLADRLRRHAAEARQEPAKSMLEKIIAEHSIILELRGNGHSTRQINIWLAREGIHIGEGTLRNYIPRIIAALHQARQAGIETPDDADLLRICRDLERTKAARLNAPRAVHGYSRTPPVSYPQGNTSPSPARPHTLLTIRSNHDL